MKTTLQFVVASLFFGLLSVAPAAASKPKTAGVHTRSVTYRDRGPQVRSHGTHTRH